MDLTTKYLGLTLRNPVVASAGPLTQTLDGVKRLSDAGAGAIVLHSLFEEQLRAEVAREVALVEDHAESFAEALNYFPSTPMTTKSAAFSYLALVERSVKSVDVPVIASLNGADEGGWVQFARELEDAGAAALELNTYFVPGDLETPGVWVTDRHVDILGAVRRRSASRCRSDEPLLQLARVHGHEDPGGRRGRAGAVQPVPAARTSTSRPSR